MTKIKSDSQDIELAELLQKIQTYKLLDVSYSDILPDTEELTQQDFIQILKNYKYNTGEYTILDVQSEEEFETNALPYSINLPILNNAERHKVGLIYAQHSKDKALSLAYHYAKEKENDYMKDAVCLSKGKKAIIYCWRGGVRSKYACGLLQKYNINAKRLQGGQKGFRKIVQDFLYNKTIPIISLSGLTGGGKSEILEYFQLNFPDFPVIDLEKCAGHASSVFGEIRFFLRGEIRKNQQQFETNIFMEILPHIKEDNRLPVFLSENESKKIGKLNVPPSIQNGLAKQEYITLNCQLRERVDRLVKDYFTSSIGDETLIDLAKIKAVEQLKFLSNKMSSEKIDLYCKLINENNFSKFLADILENYYDKIYKIPEKNALLILENNCIEATVEEILKFWRKNKI